jgi:phosphoribosylglycinamide formyltransferase 1
MAWISTSVLHAEGLHPSTHVHRPGESGHGQIGGDPFRSTPGAADAKHRAIAGNLLDTGDEVAHWDEEGSGERSQVPFRGLAHIEYDRVVIGHPFLPVVGGDNFDSLHCPIVRHPLTSTVKSPLHCVDRSTSGGIIDIAVLASGSGTNLQALIDTPPIRERIRLVITDREMVGALDRAAAAGIPASVVRFEDFPDREAFSSAVADTVEESGAKGIVLAGFMRILSPVFIDRFPDRILNIHPSLLPEFPGAHAVREAISHGVEKTGVTVHFVDEEVDHGPIVAQREVAVEPGDTVESLHQRIKEVEHILYPEVVARFVAGTVYVDGGRVVGR